MSIIYLQAEEWGNLIAASMQHTVAGEGSQRERLGKAYIVAQLSEANAKAYNHTYSHHFRVEGEQPVEGVTAAEVEKYSSRVSADLRQAVETVLQIRSNLIAHDGTDFADAEVLDGILWLTRGVLEKVAGKAGLRR